MPTTDGDRSRLFPAIEKKHGKAASHWLSLLKRSGATTYADQMSLLQDGHGFSRAHANAIVMHHRGSTTSRKYATVEEWLAAHSPTHAAAASRILDSLTRAFPPAELVVAWNQPMLRVDGRYVFGLSAAKNHLTVMLDVVVVEEFAEELEGYVVNKKTFNVPLDDKVSLSMLRRMVAARIADGG